MQNCFKVIKSFKPTQMLLYGTMQPASLARLKQLQPQQKPLSFDNSNNTCLFYVDQAAENYRRVSQLDSTFTLVSRQQGSVDLQTSKAEQFLVFQSLQPGDSRYICPLPFLPHLILLLPLKSAGVPLFLYYTFLHAVTVYQNLPLLLLTWK